MGGLATLSPERVGDDAQRSVVDRREPREPRVHIHVELGDGVEDGLRPLLVLARGRQGTGAVPRGFAGHEADPDLDSAAASAPGRRVVAATTARAATTATAPRVVAHAPTMRPLSPHRKRLPDEAP